MKITIQKQILENIISNLNSYLEKRDSSAITSHIYFNASNKSLIIRATDQEMGLNYTIKDLVIKEEGCATAHGKDLLDRIKSLKDGEITIYTENDIMYIKQNLSLFDLNMQRASDYPDFPTIENKNKFNINANLILAGLKKVESCIDANNAKIEFTGALLDIKKDRLNIVGTDGKRVTAYTINVSSDEEFKIILPKRAISEFSKLINQKIEIFYDDIMLIAKSEDFTFFIKLINGKYADYERLLSQNYSNEITLKRDEIVGALKTVRIVDENVNIIFSKNTIDFMVLAKVGSKGKTTIETELDVNNKYEINVKNKNMLDFLASVDTEFFTLKYNEPGLPILLNSENLTAVMTQIRN